MTLYVYNTDLERIGLIEDIDSLQWLSEYQDAGEVKLVCAATSKNCDLLQDDYRLYCTDQKESAIIRQVEIKDDGKSSQLVVRAVLSARRWEDRVIMATENIGNAETGMLLLTSKNRRGLPGITATAAGFSVIANTQTSWGNVLEAEKQLAAMTGLGFIETFDPVFAVETFSVYEGENRVSGDGYNGYFGDDIGNLEDIRIVHGSQGWKNVAIVGGSGEGADRTVITVTLGGYEGDDRREMWVDAKDIGRSYQIATPDGQGGYTYTSATYTEEQYNAMLYARGLEKLAQQLQTLEVSATLGQGLMTYGVDYSLGDVVPIKHSKYKVSLSARITAVRTIYEKTGKKINAVLSDFSIIKGVSI